MTAKVWAGTPWWAAVITATQIYSSMQVTYLYKFISIHPLLLIVRFTGRLESISATIGREVVVGLLCYYLELNLLLLYSVL